MDFKPSLSPLGILGIFLAPVLLSPMAIALEFPPTGGVGAPSGGTSGGGVRGSSACITKDEGLSLMALRPALPDNYVGTTARNNPTIFFYVPKTKAQTAEFILVDEDGNDIYTKNLQLSQDGGLISIDMTLPELPSNMEETEYTWQFVLVCNPSDRGADEWVEGQIRQITLDSALTAALEAAEADDDRLKKAELLAGAEIWYDSLAEAAQLRTLEPQAWESLLKSVGLDKLTETEILPFEALIDNP